MNAVLLDCVQKNFSARCPQHRLAAERQVQSLSDARPSDFPLFLNIKQWLALIIRTVGADHAMFSHITPFLQGAIPEARAPSGIDGMEAAAAATAEQAGPTMEVDM
eukprot:1233736-Rhodomonas_salina.1